MKKLSALLLTGAMVFSLTACGGTNTSAPEADTQNDAAVVTDDTTEVATDAATTDATAADYKLGMGIVTKDSSSEGTAQVDATVATVITDADGKIVSCYIDVAQTKVGITDGEIASDVDVRTKQEKGSDYGMVAYGNAIAEWNEQADFFAQQIVGLTGEEVAGLATEVNESNHEVSADADMLAGCTMAIADFKEAVAKACADEYAKSFSANADEMKLGLGVVTDASSSTSATADEDGVAKIYSDFAAVVVDANGIILADLCDAIQPKVNFDTTGNETSFDFTATKKELKNDYNMVTYGGAIAEWMDQATAFENYVVGKDAAAVAGIPTEVNEEGNAVTTDADLLAGCTISISGFQATLAKAFANAR